MTKPWNEIRRTKVPADREAEVAAGVRALRDALDLRQLRAGRGITQVELASRLRKSQGNVSELERREDVYLSSLREYVEALGGRLEVTAVFDDDRQIVDIGRPLAAREVAAAPYGVGRRRGSQAEPPSARSWNSDDLFQELRRYERQCEAAGLQPTSVFSYVDYGRRFLRWRVGDYRPRQATGPERRPSRGPATMDDLMVDLDAYETDLRAAGLRPNAVHTYVIHARQFIRWLDGDFEPGSRL
jgi:transcriptional regulator with XRE-family HTH domain